MQRRRISLSLSIVVYCICLKFPYWENFGFIGIAHGKESLINSMKKPT
jgi:hypothetical protein